MLPPFTLQRLQHARFGVRVDDVHVALSILQEPMDAVDGLDEIVELEANAQEHSLGTMALEVAP